MFTPIQEIKIVPTQLGLEIFRFGKFSLPQLPPPNEKFSWTTWTSDLVSSVYCAHPKLKLLVDTWTSDLEPKGGLLLTGHLEPRFWGVLFRLFRRRIRY